MRVVLLTAAYEVNCNDRKSCVKYCFYCRIGPEGVTVYRTVRKSRLRVYGPSKVDLTRMWDNAQRDGRPAEHRWRPLFNTAKFG